MRSGNPIDRAPEPDLRSSTCQGHSQLSIHTRLVSTKSSLPARLLQWRTSLNRPTACHHTPTPDRQPDNHWLTISSHQSNLDTIIQFNTLTSHRNSRTTLTDWRTQLRARTPARVRHKLRSKLSPTIHCLNQHSSRLSSTPIPPTRYQLLTSLSTPPAHTLRQSPRIATDRSSARTAASSQSTIMASRSRGSSHLQKVMSS